MASPGQTLLTVEECLEVLCFEHKDQQFLPVVL